MKNYPAKTITDRQSDTVQWVWRNIFPKQQSPAVSATKKLYSSWAQRKWKRIYCDWSNRLKTCQVESNFTKRAIKKIKTEFVLFNWHSYPFTCCRQLWQLSLLQWYNLTPHRVYSSWRTDCLVSVETNYDLCQHTAAVSNSPNMGSLKKSDNFSFITFYLQMRMINEYATSRNAIVVAVVMKRLLSNTFKVLQLEC